jgi:hypothetical protein
VALLHTTERDSAARRGLGTRTWLLAGAIVLLATVAATVALLLSDGDDGDSPARGAPREVSVQELRSAAEAAGHPVYWAGAIPDRRLELTETARGHLFVRYLPEGARAGDDRPAFTAVGSYPLEDAYQSAARSAARRGSVRREAPGGGIAVWTRGRPTSVYLAYPGSDVLVEVYDPSAARARQLALSGEVGPVR